MARLVEVGCRGGHRCGRSGRRGAAAGRRWALAAAVFVGAAVRRRGVERALDSGGFAAVSDNAVLALTLAATVLALGTLAVIVAQP
jgi:hypothetical protein